MKKVLKQLLIVVIVMMIVLASLPASILVVAETNRSFNIFLDAGEITDEFINATSKLISENWSNEYFSHITMTIGEKTMWIDGVEKSITKSATMDGEQLVLPLMELAEAVGADATIDKASGDAVIEEDGIKTTLDATMLNLNSNVVIRDNDAVSGTNNESTVEYHPVITKRKAEELLFLDVVQENDHIIINKPYQTKEILLFVKNGKELRNTYQAKNVVTNNQGLYFLQFSSELETKTAYESYINDATIEYVTLNGVKAVTALPSSGSWGTNGNDNSMGIQADRFKTYLQDNDEGIIVAVLDSGVDSEYLPNDENGRQGHPHLEGRTTVPTSVVDNTAGYNYIANNNDPFDDNGHGTHVAGTIVDCTPDNVRILPIKVLGANGKGDDLNISYGMNYAANQGAKVINMSFGGNCTSLECIIDEAVDSIVNNALEANQTPPIFVAAAGNESMNVQEHCPANLSTKYDNLITVAAIDDNDLKADFSNYGTAIDVCAPGVDICSSIPGGEYDTWSGTSMAAPHVSSAVAMLALEYPTYSASQLKSLIKSMVVDLGAPGEDDYYGTGRIDFRMFNGSTLPAVTSVPATQMSVKQMIYDGTFVSCGSLELECDVLAEDVVISAVVSPKECTNKSITLMSNNTDVVSCQNGVVVPQGLGSTTVNISRAEEVSKQITVDVLDNWINYAASTYAGGSGTSLDPYLISTAEQLAKLAYETRINNVRYYNQYFKMTNDIDLSGNIWTPIGGIEYKNCDDDSYQSFQGVFDGSGYAVTNMTVTAPQHRRWEYLGLFGVLKTGDGPYIAEIKNLAVINATVEGNCDTQNQSSGVLCGRVESAIVSNCYTQGISSGAGLIGWISNYAEVKDCYSNVEAGMAGLINENKQAWIHNTYAMGSAGESGLINVIAIDADVINSFFVSTEDTLALYGFGNCKEESRITKCYYPTNYQGTGIVLDDNPDTTDLIAKPVDFFTNELNYTDEYWASYYPWDFENVWNIDSAYQGGLPYLRTFQRLCTTTPIETLSFNQSSMEIKPNESVKLDIVVNPSNSSNKALLWSSSDPSKISVDPNGNIAAVSTSGSSIITATAIDGSGKTVSCTVTVDDHMSTADAATAISLNSSISGVINYDSDVDYFVFVPADSGGYVFYSSGDLDVDGTLYSSTGSQILKSTNKSSTDKNFAIPYGSLVAGSTYYIGVQKGSSGTLGSYQVNVAKSYGDYGAVNANADARKVELYITAASVVDTIRLTFGSKTYVLPKPTGTNNTITTNGGTFKITLTSLDGGYSTKWSIYANVRATTIGSTSAARFMLLAGNATVASNLYVRNIVAYGSSYKTNLNPDSNLLALINSMATTGYTFTAYDWNDNIITPTTSTKIATGVKIVQRNSSNQIVHVHYLVLYGDVAGTGEIGDGLINAGDSMYVLQELEDDLVLGRISELAADVDHDNSITQADATLIVDHAVGNETIDQNVAITEAVDVACYYGATVAF